MPQILYPEKVHKRILNGYFFLEELYENLNSVDLCKLLLPSLHFNVEPQVIERTFFFSISLFKTNKQDDKVQVK